MRWLPVRRFAKEGDYFGAVVNLAVRATKVAPAGSVLVPETLTSELAEASAFSFHGMGPRHLKGFSEPVILYALRRGRRCERCSLNSRFTVKES